MFFLVRQGQLFRAKRRSGHFAGCGSPNYPQLFRVYKFHLDGKDARKNHELVCESAKAVLFYLVDLARFLWELGFDFFV